MSNPAIIIRTISDNNIDIFLSNTLIVQYPPRKSSNVLLIKPTNAAPVTLNKGMRIKQRVICKKAHIPCKIVFVVCLSHAFRRVSIK